MIAGVILQTITLIVLTLRTNWTSEVKHSKITLSLSLVQSYLTFNYAFVAGGKCSS